MTQKPSIRFFNDHEVRAVWDEKLCKWWFSVVDIVAVLNEQSDYTKNRNYWKYLKTKLSSRHPELVSATNQLKLTASDGKKRLTDCLDSKGIIELAKNFPNQETANFLDKLIHFSSSTYDLLKNHTFFLSIARRFADKRKDLSRSADISAVDDEGFPDRAGRSSRLQLPVSGSWQESFCGQANSMQTSSL